MSDRGELRELLEIAECELLGDTMFDAYGMLRSETTLTRWFSVGRLSDRPRGHATPRLIVQIPSFGGFEAWILVCGQRFGTNAYMSVKIDKSFCNKLILFISPLLEPSWWSERLDGLGIGHSAAVRIGQGKRVDDASMLALELERLFERYGVHTKGPVALEDGAPPPPIFDR